MRPKGLKTRMFVDGDKPGEIRKIIGLLGFPD